MILQGHLLQTINTGIEMKCICHTAIILQHRITRLFELSLQVLEYELFVMVWVDGSFMSLQE